MLGNIGYSSVQCAQVPAKLGTLSLSCPYGTIGGTSDNLPMAFGVNTDIASRSNCISDKSSPCAPNNPSLNNQFKALIGETAGDFTVDSGNLYTDQATREKCITDSSVFFIQYKCVQTEEQQQVKYESLSLTIACGALVCLLFLVTLRGLLFGGKIQQLEWDMSTITAGDYTVCFDIDKEKY